MSNKELLEVALKEAENFYVRYGPPTLRGLFYILVSKGVIPNTVTSYKKLSKVIAEARYKGEFPWYLIKDTTRWAIPLEKSTHYPTKPLTVDEIKAIMKSYIETYSDVRINPWEDQKYRIFIVLEKEAQEDVCRKLITEAWPLGVKELRVIRGYDSATDVYMLAEEISHVPRSQRPVVLLLGDFDPSGEDIARDFVKRLKMLSMRDDIVTEKVAVTLDQIIDLDLPARPEKPDELEKMRRDPRYNSYVEKLKLLSESDDRIKKFVERYGSYEIRVELDALTAIRPEEFKDIVRKAIEKYFDYEIYENVTKKKEEELKKKAEEVKRQSLEELRKVFTDL
jgi:hypothetical protein